MAVLSCSATAAKVPLRFAGMLRLYGQDSWQKIAQSRVAVIGIGGVGSWTAEALARSGVGQISLFDLDDLCASNINRQLHALDTTIGQSKVRAMAERLLQINPQLQVQAFSQFITLANLQSSLAPEGELVFDVVVEATDTVPVKAALIAWCRRHKQKLVVVGGAGGQLDPRLISSADLSRTTQDPLLAKVRNLLRREYGFSRNSKRRFAVECVYSTEQLIYPQGDGSVAYSKPTREPNLAMKLDCSGGLGAASFVTGSFGFLAAQRALCKLLG